MTIDDLVLEARTDILDDTVSAKYLWSNLQLTRYANEAVLEACSRAPLINRVLTKAITAATAEYVIDSFIKQIYVAKLDLQTTPLIQATDATLSIGIGSSWRTSTGTPTHYIRTGHKIRLYPVPIVDDTLVMTTSNIPDDDFSFEDDIDPAYHKGLLYYIAYKAYMLNDADAYNPVKAADFLKMFDVIFGVKHTAKYNSVAYDSPMYGTVSGARMC